MQDFQLLLSEPNMGVLEFRLTGEVDLGTVQTLREATRTATASGSYDCLVFDLSGLSFIDSSGLHALTEANRAMVKQGGTTRLVCGPGGLMKIFELTGLDRVFSIVGNRSEAIAAVA